MKTQGSSHALKPESVSMVLNELERLCPQTIKQPCGNIKYPYCIPGGFYQQQWDWDAFFIATHLAGRNPSRPEYFKYWTLNFLSAVLPDGDVSACVEPDSGKQRHPSLRLKPFLAQGAERGAFLLKDYSWVEEKYDLLVRIATRREKTHFCRQYGLFVWEDAMQSGADNNPAVSNDEEHKRKIAGCDINAFQWREYIALQKIAEKLGRKEDGIIFMKKAEDLKKAVDQLMWDDKEQSYWNLNTGTGRWRKHVSYSNFVPLWAGIAPADRAAVMIRRYLWNEDHMLTPFGLRSLSKQDPCYNNVNMILPHSNWQGPVWPIANYFYFVALMKYGFRDEAQELVGRLVPLYLNDIKWCGSLHENYDAETGKPLAPSASQSSHGQEGGFVGWNLLLQDMIEMLQGRPDILDIY